MLKFGKIFSARSKFKNDLVSFVGLNSEAFFDVFIVLLNENKPQVLACVCVVIVVRGV